MIPQNLHLLPLTVTYKLKPNSGLAYITLPNILLSFSCDIDLLDYSGNASSLLRVHQWWCREMRGRRINSGYFVVLKLLTWVLSVWLQLIPMCSCKRAKSPIKLCAQIQIPHMLQIKRSQYLVVVCLFVRTHPQSLSVYFYNAAAVAVIGMSNHLYKLLFLCSY